MSEAVPQSAGVVLMVGSERREIIAEALQGYEVLQAAGSAEALQILAGRRVDVVLAQLRLDGESGVELARACAARFPKTRRILLCAYPDLPDVVAAQGYEVLHRVVPLQGAPEKIRNAVIQTLLPRDEVSTSKGRGLDWQAAQDLLRWTAVRLTQVRGVVIRQLRPHELQLEFVLLASRRNEALRADILRRWLWPLKPRDAKPARADRGHPVLSLLGDLSIESEVYAKEVRGEGFHLYLALLPWRKEPRLTVALGICADAERPDFRELLAAAHDQAVAEVAEFSMPDPGGHAHGDDPPEPSGPGLVLPEYDWVATPDYVGPDRRRAPTSFLNRYLLTGRRKRVPARIARLTHSFTDRFHDRVWRLFFAFVVLAFVDTALTFVCVRSGLVKEVNPVLRPLVLHRPWLFAGLKTGLSLTAFLVVARFHLFRRGLLLLDAVVGVFGLLDLYWLGLLLFDQLTH